MDIGASRAPTKSGAVWVGFNFRQFGPTGDWLHPFLEFFFFFLKKQKK